MIERVATIVSTVGLHARPAARFAEAAAQYDDLQITITVQGEPEEEARDASSILSVMGLGASHGDKVVLRSEGKGAEEALGHLVKLLETDHDAH